MRHRPWDGAPHKHDEVYDGEHMAEAKRWIVAGLLAVAAYHPVTAHAETLTVASGETIVLNGDRLFDSVTVNGTLRVAGLDESSGFLRLRTQTFTLSADGRINADGAGYRGGRGDDGAGEGHDANSGAGQTPVNMDPSVSLPGGGGSHIGAGGPGLSASCSLVTGAFGGMVYDDANAPLGLQGLGSAGGTSQAGGANAGIMLAGGNGGGVIIIEAETIQIAGVLSAVGADALAAQNAGPGGGAGGTVWLRAGALTWMGGSIDVRGGNGASGASRGGGGGGGLVVVESPLTEAELLPSVNVVGGASECPAGAGSEGVFAARPLDGCLDLDGDGANGFPCIDEDCNDLDPQVRPGGIETCNGVDDDCDNAIDEEQDGPYCSAGAAETCVQGECVTTTVDAGVPSDNAPRIELGGGLCNAAESRIGVHWPMAPALLWLATVIGLWRRNERRRNADQSERED